MLTQIFTYEEM